MSDPDAAVVEAVARLRELLGKALPGPVAWYGNGAGQHLALATTHSGRKFVMSFFRWGMRGSQPAFPVDGIMVNAANLLKFAVGNPAVTGMKQADADPTVYRHDITDIDNVEAQLLVEARNAAPALLDMLDAQAARIAALREALREVDKHIWSDPGEADAIISRVLEADHA